jgi:hypothetical protein
MPWFDKYLNVSGQYIKFVYVPTDYQIPCMHQSLNKSLSIMLLFDFSEILYAMKSKGFRTTAWGIPYLVVPQSKKNSEFHWMILF